MFENIILRNNDYLIFNFLVGITKPVIQYMLHDGKYIVSKKGFLEHDIYFFLLLN